MIIFHTMISILCILWDKEDKEYTKDDNVKEGIIKEQSVKAGESID